jgi:hypothetical protein
MNTLYVSENASNSAYVFDLIENCIIEFSMTKESFLVLLSDATRYMASAANLLKAKYSNLFYFTCIAHLYHNISLGISAYYSDINFPTSSIKAALNKSKKVTSVRIYRITS